MTSTTHIPRAAIDGRQAVTEASQSRIVQKPVPTSQRTDPRKYQLDQIKRRFSPTVGTLQNGTTTVRFRLRPSDPDFPFELEYLDCELQVPASYPDQTPTLSVKNQDIPRGFGVNIERGWDKLVSEQQGATLLALITALDKHLEAFLSEQKVDTIKLVSFKDTRHLDQQSMPLGEPSTSVAQAAPPKLPTPPPRRVYIPEPSFTGEQIAQAKARRAQEIRQLEARMGRMPLYQKSADGVVYTLPLEPKRRMELPQGLQTVQSVQLIIPLLYPLQVLRVLLGDVESQDAEPLEEAFATRAAQHDKLTLMNHLNYLSQNMHIMVKQAEAAKPKLSQPEPALIEQIPKAPETEGTSATDRDDRKGHIHIIPRPPEWNNAHDESDDSDSYDSDSWDSGDTSEEGGAATGEAHPASTSNATTGQQPERGTAISFPTIELYGIELLQITILNISTKCQRCKTLNDITGLRPSSGTDKKSTSCKKCGTHLTASFRQEFVHQNSTRAGFIDVTGCTVADMLPSTFVPTCGKCSTASQGLVSVRGEAVTNVCRECHGRFTFKIPQVKFLAISAGSALPPTLGPRRKQEKLGLHAGEPLPNRGACAHYRRSHRWFRFSCCSKVYPCDQCHDKDEDHVNEWANRMVCGWCSREQNYAVEACAFCGRSVIGRKGKGFWEGGKGTRDRVKMSRKDKRKFRRVGGSEGAKKD